MARADHNGTELLDGAARGADPNGPTGVDVAVIGAGLAGLTAAAVAARTGARVAVLDSRRPGGRASTTVVESGAVFNAGPRALYRTGAAWRVLTALGIEPRGGVAPTEGHGLRRGEVHELPGTPVKLLRSKLFSRASKFRLARLLGGLERIDADELDGVSLGRWLDDHRLDDDARALVRATVRTVTYVDDLGLSAGTAVRQLRLGLGRGQGVSYLDGGWQQLVDALLDDLAGRGVEVVTGSPVRVVEPARDGSDGRAPGWVVRTADRAVRAAAVVVATGTPDAAAGLLPGALDLGGIGPPATAACLELAVPAVPDPRFLLGLDEPLYLSAHSPVARLGPEGVNVVHVMRYGARSSAEDRVALWNHAAAAGIDRDDVIAHRFLKSMTVMGGIPLGDTGGQPGRPAVEVRGEPGLYLAGDWVGDEGLLGDAACASGERAGRLAAEAARSAAALAATAGSR